MRPIWKLLPALGLCASLGLSSAHAQPPMGRPGGAPMGEHRADPKPDAQVDAWVKTLTDKMNDPHDSIRDSSRAGIISVGRAALPSLKKLAEGDDGAKATAARRLIDAIEHRPMPGMGGGMPGMGGGMPGMSGGMPPFGGRGGFGGGSGGAGPRGEGRRPDAAPDRPTPGAGAAPDRRPDANAPKREGTPDRRPDAAPENRPGAGGPGAPGRVSPIAESLKGLKLNDKQQKQVDELRENFEKTMQETMVQVREGKIEQADVREKMQKLRGTMLKEMKDVLTAEQFEKFDEAMKKNRPAGGPGGAPGERPRPE